VRGRLPLAETEIFKLTHYPISARRHTHAESEVHARAVGCQTSFGLAKGTAMTDETETLFSYGTLREEKVQLSVFGRRVQGDADSIVGYRLESNKITDPNAIAISGTDAHTILRPTGDDADQIAGMALRITKEELKRADAYEDATYSRVQAKLRSGSRAWVYVKV
jgi:gamma-glutamylcyclotransferase (GGCT)/AIG2-like uncharacterized protein YtfP